MTTSHTKLVGIPGAAMRLRPAGGIVHESLHLAQELRIELTARLCHRQHVPPRRELVQRDAEIAEDFLSVRINVIEEEHDAVLACAARVANCLDEIHLALTVGGEV